jgi:hypothetical protein
LLTSVSQLGLLASFYGRQLRFTQFCQFFSVALGSALRRDEKEAPIVHFKTDVGNALIGD